MACSSMMKNFTERNKYLLEELTHLTRLIDQRKKYVEVKQLCSNTKQLDQCVLRVKLPSSSTIPSTMKTSRRTVKDFSCEKRKSSCLPNDKEHNHPEVKFSGRIHVNPKSLPKGVDCKDFQNQKLRSVYVNPHFRKEECRIPLASNSDSSICEKEQLPKSSSYIQTNPEARTCIHINPKVKTEKMKNANTKTKISKVIHVTKMKSPKVIHVNPKMRTSKVIHVNPSVLFKRKGAVVDSNAKTEKVTKEVLGVGKTGTDQSAKRAKNSLGSIGNLKSAVWYKGAQIGLLKSFYPQKHYLNENTYGRARDVSNSDLVSVSKTKLVRVPRKRKLSSSKKGTLFKSSPVSVSAAKAVCSKYKFVRMNSVLSTVPKKVPVAMKSKYRIDRRTSPRVKVVKKFQVKYKAAKSIMKPSQDSYNRYHNSKKKKKGILFQNRVWKRSPQSTVPRRISIPKQRLQRIGTFPTTKTKFGEKQPCTTLVRIGGILYKTSRRKLMKSDGNRSSTLVQNGLKKYVTVRKLKDDKKKIVNVRGHKFMMDPMGKTLIRIPTSMDKKSKEVKSEKPHAAGALKRIDIGGITYVQKSPGVLERTNVHHTRTLLSQAKQKSINLLVNKRRKNNIPCIIYHHFGKCSRNEKGSCPYVHNPKQVAMCKKFLQGRCTLENCPLSHAVGPEKMPTCKYFLEGCCNRDNCPYLHVKVNDKADVCIPFLQGFCAAGEECKKRHVNICPSFEKGCCLKGKRCPYPHVTKKVKLKRPVKLQGEVIVEHSSTGCPSDARPERRKRYYETENVADTSEECEQQLPDSDADLKVPDAKMQQLESMDMNSKRIRLLQKVNLLKQAWQGVNVEGESGNSTEIQSKASDGSEMIEDGPQIKRPKLGHLPSYIPL